MLVVPETRPAVSFLVPKVGLRYKVLRSLFSRKILKQGSQTVGIQAEQFASHSLHFSEATRSSRYLSSPSPGGGGKELDSCASPEYSVYRPHSTGYMLRITGSHEGVPDMSAGTTSIGTIFSRSPCTMCEPCASSMQRASSGALQNTRTRSPYSQSVSVGALVLARLQAANLSRRTWHQGS